MNQPLTRRQILVAGAGLAGSSIASKSLRIPEIWLQNPVKPIIICSPNGHTFKNGGKETGLEIAWRMMTSGSDILDSLIACVNIPELDPKEMSVGYGGVPNAEGVVQLDSCCMHGPRRWAGGVAALEGVRTPSKVALEVARQTDHHLLVGKGAQEFARNLGFTIEPDLNTEASRKTWLEWKRRTDPDHYLNPGNRQQGTGSGGGSHPLPAARSPFPGVLADMVHDGWLEREHVYGTINCNGLNSRGDMAGVTTTSGLAFKIPGRVGDSPILGAGLYVDNAIGAAGSTGRGEANLYNLCSFFVVEQMRLGLHPKDAGIAALKRVAEQTKEKRLLNSKGQPNFGLNFNVIDAKGRFAGVSMQPSSFAVCDETGPHVLSTEPLFG